MSLLLVAALLVVATASLAAAALELASFVAFGCATYLFAWAEVIGITEVLSLFRGVSARGYLGAEAVAFAGATTAWLRAGRPRPPVSRVALTTAARRHPVVVTLAVVCGLAVVYEAFVGLSTPPTTIDELWYHLARAAAWVRHGGLYEIPGGNAAENDYPPNAEVGVLYGFAFVHRETFAAIPQLAAQGAIVLSIFGIARRLRATSGAALFAALLFVTLSGVAVDAMTALNDIVVASFVATAAYFVFTARGRISVALGGLAVGLALGTKYTAFFALPALALLACGLLPRRRLVELVAWSVLGFATVGAYGYAENVAHSHALLGAGAQEIGSSTAAVTARGTISTTARNLYRFVDLPGYRVKTRWLAPIETLGRDAFRVLHIPTAPPEASTGGSPFVFDVNVGSSTGAAWYGPLGWLLVIPLSLGFVAAWALRRVGRAQGLLALSFPIYLLVSAAVYRYTSNGRFFVTPIALTLPLAAVLYRRRSMAALVAGIAAMTLFFALAYDSDKPTGLTSRPAIWGLSRPEAMTLSLGPSTTRLIRAVDGLPSHANLGFDAAQLYLGYALYGPKLQRSLIALSALDPLGDADRLGLRAVYLGPGVSVPVRAAWNARRFGGAGTLFVKG